jgi:DNA repair exonuclease SbcCD ATPase subunit
MDIKELINRRDSIRSQLDRAKGQLESSERERQDLIQECEKYNVKPENLDSTIEKLEAKFQELLSAFSADIESAEKKINELLKEKNL